MKYFADFLVFTGGFPILNQLNRFDKYWIKIQTHREDKLLYMWIQFKFSKIDSRSYFVKGVIAFVIMNLNSFNMLSLNLN